MVAAVRANRHRQGNAIADMDLLTAGMALDREPSLSTRNTRHFVRVPALRQVKYRRDTTQ